MSEPRLLDDRGRCCGRKPLVYKRPHRLWCSRCSRTYTPEGRQVESSAWKSDGVGGLWCTLCHDTGRITRRITRRNTSPMEYVCAGDPPEDARGLAGFACFDCAIVP